MLFVIRLRLLQLRIFSTKNASIAAFNSTTIELTIIIFMIIAATNFSLHYLFLAKGKFDYFKDEEFKIFFYIIIFVSLTLFLDINVNGSYNWSSNSIKDASFYYNISRYYNRFFYSRF